MQSPRIATLLFTDVEGSTPLLASLGDTFVDVIERQRARWLARRAAQLACLWSTAGRPRCTTKGYAHRSIQRAPHARHSRW
jgi:hypothetical protein